MWPVRGHLHAKRARLLRGHARHAYPPLMYRRLPFHAMLGVLAWLLGACAGGSTSVPTGTLITPDFFQYATMVEAPEDGSTGGWRAVCIHAQVGQAIAEPQGGQWNTSRQCSLQFEVPIINHQHGFITLRMAQRISADVANAVAYRVLTREPALTVVTCDKLKRGMNKALDVAIRGSKVNHCGASLWNQAVPEVVWPPPGE